MLCIKPLDDLNEWYDLWVGDSYSYVYSIIPSETLLVRGSSFLLIIHVPHLTGIATLTLDSQ